MTQLLAARRRGHNRHVGRRLLVAGAVAVVLGTGAVYWLRFSPRARDQASVRKILGDVLTSPGTATYVSIDVLERRGNYRLARAVVDAKNGFNAEMRLRLCLVWHEVNGEPVYYRDRGIATECPETLGYRISEGLKDANNWPAYGE